MESSSSTSQSQGQGIGRGRGQESGGLSLNRGRGRGNRGGLGKYLRARGRGHRGGGRPAVFSERLLLEGEGSQLYEDDEEREERLKKYSRRQLGTNADRYKEEEPELGSDGEPIVEPEVDLSTFLEKQRTSDDTISPALVAEKTYDEDEIDHSLAHITSNLKSKAQTGGNSNEKKGKVKEIEWDKELDELSREKAVAEAQWDLKTRFKAKSEKLKAKPVFKSTRERQAEKYEQAPELPTDPNAKSDPKPEKNSIAEMEAFLDDLLS